MKHTTRTIAFLLVAGLAVCCTALDWKAATGAKHHGTATAQCDKAKTDTREAMQAVRDCAYAKKAELIDKRNNEPVAFQAEMDRLSAKVDRSRGAAKADAKIKLEAARGKWAQSQEQIARAEFAPAYTWADVKGGFEKSYVDIKDSFEMTRRWLSDKIEP